jgi:hypothetical protein
MFYLFYGLDYISLSSKEGLNTLDDFLDLELIMVN